MKTAFLVEANGWLLLARQHLIYFCLLIIANTTKDMHKTLKQA